MPDRPFVILTVCTGNICRSPMAEQFFRAAAGTGPLVGRVATWSAGTSAMAGHPMDPESARLSIEFGGDPQGATGTQLEPDFAERSDLVLTMTTEQRDRVLRDTPRANARAFTLREFARASAAVDGIVATEPLAAMQELVARARSLVVPGDDDIDDPYRRGADVHRAVAEQIAQSVAEVVSAFERALGRQVPSHRAASGIPAHAG